MTQARANADADGSGVASIRFRVGACLLGILAVAAALRFAGLAWGLPSALHWFSYHPDEALILLAASKANVFAGQFDPGFYNYGSLLIYLISITTRLLDAYAPLSQPWQEMARMTLVGRAWCAGLGVATVYVVYLTGSRLWGRRAGLLAAAALAVAPMHAVHAHFATVDVPAAFFVALALYHAVRYPDGGWKTVILCGLFSGFAAGTKYSAGLAVLSGIAAVALSGANRPRGLRAAQAGVMLAVAALAFLAATPGVLLNTPRFLNDFLYETRHVRTGHGLVFAHTGPGWWYHLSYNLWQGVGPFLPILGALAAIRACRRGLGTASAALLAFAAAYFLLISAAAVRFQRYDIPLLPVLALGFGWALSRWRGWWQSLSGAALAATLIMAMGSVSTMAAPGGDWQMTGQPYRGDPRDAAITWFNRAVPPGRTVGLLGVPWFYTPPFTIANAGPQSRSVFGHEAVAPRYRLLLPDAPGEDGWTAWPDFVVISDYEYGDALRLNGNAVPERAAQIRRVKVDPAAPAEAQRIARPWNNVVSRYQLAAMWSPRMHALGLSWAKRTLPPHDAFYPYPTIIIFRRDDASMR